MPDCLQSEVKREVENQFSYHHRSLAWVGRDYNKLSLESEGAWMVDKEKFEEASVELFYGRDVVCRRCPVLILKTVFLTDMGCGMTGSIVVRVPPSLLTDMLIKDFSRQ